jgi:large subunit ribosomal protein L35Ae
MQGRIANYRNSDSLVYPTHAIVHPEGCATRAAAAKFVGKKVVWAAPGKAKKTIIGKIASAHGNSGAVRVIFERGIPGQALGQDVAIE